MKKFFKALALVLALTLVIGTIPASAAINFELKQKSKIIYIDGSKGTKKDADGNVVKCKTVNKYTVTKLIKGFDADTMDVKITTADKTIASKNNKYDRVYAKGIGTTTATIKIYYKDDLKSDIGTLKLKVKVKKNATDLPYYVADADLNLIDVDADYVFACNTDYYIVLNRYAYLDPTDLTKKVKVDTDKRALTGKEDEVDIVAGGKAGNIFKVNFKKAGEIVLKASAYQSDKFDQPTKEKEIKVKAGYTALAVAQSSLDKVVVTFAQPIAKGNLANDNFKLYTKVGKDGETAEIIASAVKGITYNDTEKEKVEVQFGSRFVAGKEYFVSYNGEEVGSFKAINVTADSVKFIELVPDQEFEVETPGSLKYVLLDESKIDITDALNGVLDGDVTAELADKDDSASNIWGIDDLTIYLSKVDSLYDVNIKYSWYDSTGIAQKVEGTGVVKCVPKKVWEQVSFKAVIGSDKPIVKNDTINSECVDVKTLALGDSAQKLQIAVGYTLNGTTKYDTFDNNVTKVYEYYKAECGKPEVAMIVEGNYVYANGANATENGTVTNPTDIVIYGVKFDNNGKEIDEVVGTIPVVVKPTRKASSFKVNVNKTTLNQAYDKDQIEFDLLLLDQYGDEIDGETATISQIASASYNGPYFVKTSADTVKGSTKEWILNNKNLITVYDSKTGNPLTGTIIVEFECKGMKYRVSNIDCGYATEATEQKLTLSGTELKTGVVNKTASTFDKTTGDQTFDQSYIEISLSGVNNKKYAVTGAAVSFSSKAPVAENDTDKIANYYVYTVKKDGNLITDAAKINLKGDKIYNVVPEKDRVASGSAVIASGSAVRLAAGQYTVELWQYTVDTSKKIATPRKIETKIFTVVDDQTKLTFTTKKIESIGVPLDTYEIKDCFEFKFGNDVVTDVDLEVVYTGDKSQARVKKATYTVKNIDLGTYTVSTDVNVTVRK